MIETLIKHYKVKKCHIKMGFKVSSLIVSYILILAIITESICIIRNATSAFFIDYTVSQLRNEYELSSIIELKYAAFLIRITK